MTLLLLFSLNYPPNDPRSFYKLFLKFVKSQNYQKEKNKKKYKEITKIKIKINDEHGNAVEESRSKWLGLELHGE